MHALRLGCLLACLLAAMPYHAVAEDAPAAGDGEAVAGEDTVPILREAEAAEAKKLVAALNKARKRKSSRDLTKALAALEGLKHKDFIKPLVKILTHDNARAAMQAGDALEFRATADDIKTLWKQCWAHKKNKRRYNVRARILRAYGRLDHALDKKQFAEVTKAWDWMIREPQIAYGTALADMCWYFGHRKDKRMALRIARELDQPGTTDVHSEFNPPREWWEKRVKMWQVMHKPAIKALEKMTGQTFSTVEGARKWFEANEKDFGVEWVDD